MLNEINDQAGQHEVIAENLSTAVVSDLSILVKSMRDDRRKVRNSNINKGRLIVFIYVYALDDSILFDSAVK